VHDDLVMDANSVAPEAAVKQYERFHRSPESVHQ